MDMYFPVDMEPINPPVVMVAAANNNVREKVVGVCTIADNLSGFDFGGAAQGYLIGQGKTLMEVDISNVKTKLISIIRKPEHGRLLMDETGPYVAGTYIPEQGFVGKDRAEAIVSVGGDVVRVVYYFAVQSKPTDSLTDSQRKRLCPKSWWIISGTPDGDSDLTSGGGEKSLLAILSGFGEMTLSNLSARIGSS